MLKKMANQSIVLAPTRCRTCTGFGSNFKVEFGSDPVIFLFVILINYFFMCQTVIYKKEEYLVIEGGQHHPFSNAFWQRKFLIFLTCVRNPISHIRNQFIYSILSYSKCKAKYFKHALYLSPLLLSSRVILQFV